MIGTAQDLEAALLNIGAVQFGQFEVEAQPGVFEPVRINLQLLASYPKTLQALVRALVPLARPGGISHLLAMSDALPVAFALSLESGLPLVFPAAGDPDRLEGAFDYNVPALLITNVLAEGGGEAAMIRHVHRHGLDVEGILAVYDLGLCGPFQGPGRSFTASSLWNAADVCRLGAARSPHLGAVVSAWLDQRRGQTLTGTEARPPR